jgi:DNA (cytosine-5)-methyltransferase 1
MEANLAWASIRCQYRSFAGDCDGPDGQRSGTFWPLWKLMRALNGERLGPRTIVLKNLCGALTGGSGYHFGAMTIAEKQSQPLAFCVACIGRLQL